MKEGGGAGLLVLILRSFESPDGTHAVGLGLSVIGRTPFVDGKLLFISIYLVAQQSYTFNLAFTTLPHQNFHIFW